MIVESDELEHRYGWIHLILVNFCFLKYVKALALVGDCFNLIKNIPQLGIFFVYPLIKQVLPRFLRLRLLLMTMWNFIRFVIILIREVMRNGIFIPNRAVALALRYMTLSLI